MHIHPILSGQLANERQREMLTQASRLRLAREVRHASLVTKRAEPAPRRKTAFPALHHYGSTFAHASCH